MKTIITYSIAILFAFFAVSCSEIKKDTDIVYQKDSGTMFHTIYSMTYSSPDNLQEEIETELKKFDGSLSMFNDTSTISRINKNDTTVKVDPLFTKLFQKAMEISQLTDGAFDITVAPFVNIWGFGFKNSDKVTPAMIDSMKAFVGYKKVHMKDGKVIKEDSRTTFDASAIAKGLSSDIVAEYLNRKGVDNYMIEIGGEVVTKGKNPKGELWHIGISKPVEDSVINNEIIAVLALDNVGLATSGNYRNFYIKDGKKYAHTIDPSTGYPVQHSLLSASVIAKDCMTADAFATSFMVMGVEKSMQYVNTHRDIEAYFIYSDSTGKYQIAMSPGMKKYVYKEMNGN